MSHDVKSNEDYWNSFYQQDVIRVPSQFCVMVATEANSENCLVEFGCGNGRDSLYFSTMGLNVCSIDLSYEAIASCRMSAGIRGMKNVEFIQGSLANSNDMSKLTAKARKASKSGKITGYSRFVMHSINEEQETAFLQNISTEMQSGETVFLEYRSKEDEKLKKTFGGHYRRFVNTDEFIRKATQDCEFKLVYELTGQGMARYKTEDPFVSRVILEKK